MAWSGKSRLFRRNPLNCKLRFISDKAQNPPRLGPQSWQVCLLEGCMWEHTKVPQEIPRAAQAGGHALLLTGLLSGAGLMLRDAVFIA